MSWFKRLKEFIKINFKSKCFSSCCIDTDINIDVDGDGEKDIHIGIHGDDIEINS